MFSGQRQKDRLFLRSFALNRMRRAGNLRGHEVFFHAADGIGCSVLCFAGASGFDQRPQLHAARGVGARRNGFYGFTRDHGDEIVLTNRAARLVFDVDSASAEINGVNVRLSFPVANSKGVPFIAQFDLDKTVRPLLFPSRYLDPKKITTICLDPGHGGRDTGNRVGGFFTHNEKTYTLALALELRDQLKQLGFNVVLTRSTDTYVELPVAFRRSPTRNTRICL